MGTNGKINQLRSHQFQAPVTLFDCGEWGDVTASITAFNIFGRVKFNQILTEPLHAELLYTIPPFHFSTAQSLRKVAIIKPVYCLLIAKLDVDT
jgi:hypothetical protein